MAWRLLPGRGRCRYHHEMTLVIEQTAPKDRE